MRARSARRSLLIWTLPALALLTAVLVPEAGASGADGAVTQTPIRHFITLMQENHTFDNYFGTYPGADGIPEDVCMPRDPSSPDAGCTKPFHIGGRPVEDLGHSERVFRDQYRDGAMDGFISAFDSSGIKEADLAMGHYDDTDLPYYWNVADNFVLFDRFFTSAHGGSLSNHMFWVAGTAGPGKGETVPPEGFALPTIFDRLEASGISWKFYIQNYDPTINFRNLGNGDRASQVVWAPILNFPRFLDTPDLFAKIVPLDEYFEDLDAGTLPEVSYIVPSGASEHPPGRIQSGETFVRNLIGALSASSAWDSSAFLWTYDDWGGWYDHVPPPQVDEEGYGFRAPALLVSPYAKRGQVNHTELDFTSILAFIEHNWDLDPLAARDAAADPFLSAFAFDQPPRPAQILATDREPPLPDPPVQVIVYFVYGAAMVLAALPIAIFRRSQGRRRRSLSVAAGAGQ